MRRCNYALSKVMGMRRWLTEMNATVTLDVNMIAFLAGFLRDSDEMVTIMGKDDSFKEPLIVYFSSVVYCSAVDAEIIICPSCGNNNTQLAIDICETAHMRRSRKFDSNFSMYKLPFCAL